MRIIGGKYRGTKLHTPQNENIRPTADKTRQAIFNILTNSLKIDFEGKVVADICAGTGALGFEALSHGAEKCCFYDQASLDLIHRNAEKLKCLDKIQLIKADATKLPKARDKFDFIFIDPPYKKGFLETILHQLLTKDYMDENTLVICEEDKKAKINLTSEVKMIDQRTYGKTQILILMKS